MGLVANVQGGWLACRVACCIGFGIGCGGTAVGANIIDTPEKSLPHPHPISLRVPYRYLVRTEIPKIKKFPSVDKERVATLPLRGEVKSSFVSFSDGDLSSKEPKTLKTEGKIPQPAVEVKSAESIAGKICTWHIPFTNLWYNTTRFRQAEVRPRPETGIRGNNNNDLPALMGLCSAHRSDPIRAGFIMQTDIDP